MSYYNKRVKPRVVSITTTTGTITEPVHEGKTVMLNSSAGSTLTLPAASGSGARYEFVVGTALTTSNYVIQVANTADIIQGIAWVKATASDQAQAFATSATSDTITMDGVEQGGAVGDMWIIIDTAANTFTAHGLITATTSEVTPFSAAV